MITINFEKALVIAHDRRRIMRAKEFEPYDQIVSKQISPLSVSEAEEKRQQIRVKYAKMQEELDAASTVDELKSLLG